jgi:hypothetical protein
MAARAFDASTRLTTKEQTKVERYAAPENFLEIEVRNPKTESDEKNGRFTTYEISVLVGATSSALGLLLAAVPPQPRPATGRKQHLPYNCPCSFCDSLTDVLLLSLAHLAGFLTTSAFLVPPPPRLQRTALLPDQLARLQEETVGCPQTLQGV